MSPVESTWRVSGLVVRAAVERPVAGGGRQSGRRLVLLQLHQFRHLLGLGVGAVAVIGTAGSGASAAPAASAAAAPRGGGVGRARQLAEVERGEAGGGRRGRRRTEGRGCAGDARGLNQTDRALLLLSQSVCLRRSFCYSTFGQAPSSPSLDFNAADDEGASSISLITLSKYANRLFYVS